MSLTIILCAFVALSQPRTAEAAFLPQGVMDFFARIGLVHSQPDQVTSLPVSTVPNVNSSSKNDEPRSGFSGWSEYTNDFYNFSVKIPTNWRSFEQDASNKFNPYVEGHISPSTFTNVVFTSTDISTKKAEEALPRDFISMSISPKKYLDQSVKNIDDYWNSIDTNKIKRGVGPEAAKEYCQNRLVDKLTVDSQKIIIIEGICSGDKSWSQQALFIYGENFYQITPSPTVNSSDFRYFVNSFSFSTTRKPPTQSSITLLSPNGGENMEKGKTYTISWNTSQSFKAQYPKVSITLVAERSLQAVSPDQHFIVNNTGNYQWTIPNIPFTAYVQDNPGGQYTLKNLDNSSNYKFLIEAYPPKSTMAGGPFDYSDNYFHVITPSVVRNPFTVISDNVFLAPNDGSLTIPVIDPESGKGGDTTEAIMPIVISKAFYASHPDQYDFMVILAPTFPNPGFDSSASVNNSVYGIGMPVNDLSSTYGSGGTLKSIASIYNLDNGTGDLLHEISHNWLMWISDPNLKINDGTGQHWSLFIDTATRENGYMYFSPNRGHPFIDNGDGTFSLDSVTPLGSPSYHKFNSMELYLMGLLPATQVTPLTLWQTDLTRLTSTPMVGTKRSVTVQDIINIAGQRKPSYPNTQRNFKIAYVLVPKKGEIIDSSIIEKVKKISTDFSKEWSFATRGLSTINGISASTINTNQAPSPSISPTPIPSPTVQASTPEKDLGISVQPLGLKSVIPSVISIGSRVTLSGSGFTGHDTLVWITQENAIKSGKGEAGIIWGGMPQSDSSINFTVPSRVCTYYTGASGKACDTFMNITDGDYVVYVQNGANVSNYLPVRWSSLSSLLSNNLMATVINAFQQLFVSY